MTSLERFSGEINVKHHKYRRLGLQYQKNTLEKYIKNITLVVCCILTTIFVPPFLTCRPIISHSITLIDIIIRIFFTQVSVS